METWECSVIESFGNKLLYLTKYRIPVMDHKLFKSHCTGKNRENISGKLLIFPNVFPFFSLKMGE